MNNCLLTPSSRSIKNNVPKLHKLQITTQNLQTKTSTSKTNSTSSNVKNRCSSCCGTRRNYQSNPYFVEMSNLLKDTKDYNEKVEKLKNRIVRLQKEEEEYIIKVKKLKEKEKIEEKIRYEKEQRKKELNKLKKEMKNEILEKKKQNAKLKQEVKENLQKSINESLQNKRNKYKIALNDKFILKTIALQYNTTNSNQKNYTHEKIKYQRNKYETKIAHQKIKSENFSKQKYLSKIEHQKELNRSLHKTFNHLEAVEKRCIESLARTMTESSEMKKNVFIFSGKKKGLNRSMGDEKIGKYLDKLNLSKNENNNNNPNNSKNIVNGVDDSQKLRTTKTNKKIYIRNRISKLQPSSDSKFNYVTIN